MSFDKLEFWVILVPVLAAAVVSVVNALRLKQVPEIVTKLEDVHTIVNGNLTTERAEKAAVLAENKILQTLLVAKQLELDTAEKTRLALAVTPVAVVTPSPSILISEPSTGQATTP